MVPSGGLFLVINIGKQAIPPLLTRLGEFVIFALRVRTEPCGHFLFLVDKNDLPAFLMVKQVLDERITDHIRIFSVLRF